jgi:hypothetical protein
MIEVQTVDPEPALALIGIEMIVRPLPRLTRTMSTSLIGRPTSLRTKSIMHSVVPRF